jgi:F0F1-type ATP synthase assembly protein I
LLPPDVDISFLRKHFLFIGANPVADKDNGNLKGAMMAVADGVLGAAALVVIGMWLGGWLDQKFATAPWFSLGLSLTGGGAGLARLVIKAINIEK